MKINVPAIGSALAGTAVGAAVGFGQAKVIAAPSADTPWYIASQAGAGVLGGVETIYSGAVGGMLVIAGGVTDSPKTTNGGYLLLGGALGTAIGTIVGMTAEHGNRD